MFEQNVGQFDRIARIILGLIFAVLVYLFYTDQLLFAVIFGLLSVIMFITAIFGSCPIYSTIKFSTKKN
jgi:hypothetical protein